MQNTTNVLWENFYYTRPLTFWEFVQDFKDLKPLFPCIESALKDFDEDSKKFPREIYVQGATGIGKGVYCYFVLLYKIYLFLLLKNPSEVFSHAPETVYSVLFAGSHSEDVFNGLLHFIQSTGSGLFCLTHVTGTSINFVEDIKIDYARPDSQVDFWVKKDQEGKYWFQSSFGNKLEAVIVHGDCDIIGRQPAISYLTDTDYELYRKVEMRVAARFFNLPFTTIIVDKAPNNLYTDVLDQIIKEKENDPIAVVERFCPLFYRDCKTIEDILGMRHPYVINTLTGEVKNRDDEGISDLNWSCFPEKWGQLDLYKMAKTNPEAFIRDILGEPLPGPLSKEYKVSDTLSAMNTIKNLINNYHIQIQFGSEGMFLRADDVGTIKV